MKTQYICQLPLKIQEDISSDVTCNLNEMVLSEVEIKDHWKAQ